ncbi:uncharacterized protein LOC121745265 isoform X2 [Salvia splendens]|uniref:uncharacterized protein LOC121745265 isoform X2 n=1 Tax=Salvia splendens TaxID=180675 RepID=UPI001C271AE0|nr:uncharacterized protein LOC121745265 isoform X2 [Salvia splendens]
MAASANNPSGAKRDGNTNNNNNGNCNRNGTVPENTSGSGSGVSAQTSLRHNPGISLDWTPEEQSTLEDLLTKYASEPNIIRYAKIAQALKDKTVRDIALRCRWMNEKAIDSLPKSSQVANHTNGLPYGQPILMESDDGISYDAIGGVTGQLLEQSANVLDQISANFSAFKVHENIDLFCQARKNILSILNDFHDLPEIMKQMPPLPVKLNVDLANSILPQAPTVNNS